MAQLTSIPPYLLPDGTWGLCGGMCFGSLDRFFRQEPVPSITNPPTRGSPLFSELVNRQLASVDSVGWTTILDYQIRPDEGAWYELQHSLGYLSQSNEWPSVKSKIDSGIPTTLCLIRAGRLDPNIGKNHQVVVYGYDINSSKVTLKVYDPNYPDNDNVVIGFTLGQDNSRIDAYQTPGPTPRGFLHIPYDRTEEVILPSQGTVVLEENLEWLWTVFS